jgi:hypothetical protein
MHGQILLRMIANEETVGLADFAITTAIQSKCLKKNFYVIDTSA